MEDFRTLQITARDNIEPYLHIDEKVFRSEPAQRIRKVSFVSLPRYGYSMSPEEESFPIKSHAL